MLSLINTLFHLGKKPVITVTLHKTALTIVIANCFLIYIASLQLYALPSSNLSLSKGKTRTHIVPCVTSVITEEIIFTNSW